MSEKPSMVGWRPKNEKSRLDRLLTDQRKSRDAIHERIVNALAELANICAALDVSIAVREDNLEALSSALSDDQDDERFATLTDQQRRFAAIRREIDEAQSVASADTQLPSSDASNQFARWVAANGAKVSAARTPASRRCFPTLSLARAIPINWPTRR